MSNKTYCQFAFNSIHWDVSGRTAPCCTFRGSNSPVNLSISEYWDSEWLADVRQKMINGEEVDGCQRCYEEERMSGTSLRKRKKIETDHLELIHITYSNICNKTCNICRPYRSHLIGREYQKINKQDPDNTWMKFKVQDQPYTNLTTKEIKFDGLDDEKINDIKYYVKNLKRINIDGGEPFMHMDYIHKILDVLIENNRYDVHIVFATNGSWNKEILESLSRFSNIQFNISVDGIDELYELVRSPHTWEWFTEKINLLNQYPNITQRYEAVIHAFNVHQLSKIVKHFGPDKTGLSMLFNQEYIGAHICPDKVLLESASDLDHLKFKNHANYLRSCINKNVEKDNMLFHEFIKTMEPIKKLKYQDYIPWSFDLVK